MICIPFILIGLSLIVLLLLKIEERKERKDLTDAHIDRYWEEKERRKFVRLEFPLNVRYSFASSPNNIKEAAKKDISKGGLGIVAYEKIPIGTILKIELFVPEYHKSVSAAGEVVWIKEIPKLDKKKRRQFSIGIRFISIDTKERAKFLEFLDRKEQE